MIKINLLPVRETKKKETERKQILTVAGAVISALIIVLIVHLTISRKISDVNEKTHLTQAEIDSLGEVIGDVANFKQNKAKIEGKLAVIKRLDARRGGPVHILDELATRLPDKLWLTTLSKSSGSLTLQGFSIDNETIATYMTRLEQSPYLSNVELERSQLKEEGSLKLNEFTIRCAAGLPEEVKGGDSDA